MYGFKVRVLYETDGLGSPLVSVHHNVTDMDAEGEEYIILSSFFHEGLEAVYRAREVREILMRPEPQVMEAF